MFKVLAVARREFRERVRTRWFLISTLLVPGLMIVSIMLPVLTGPGSPGLVRVLVVDGTTTAVGSGVAGALNSSGLFAAQTHRAMVDRSAVTVDSLAEFVRLNFWDALVELNDPVLEGGRLSVTANRELAPLQLRVLEDAVGAVVASNVLVRAGVDPSVVTVATSGVQVDQTLVGGEGATEGEQLGALVVGYLTWLVLYMAILLYGLSVMTSVVEEKTSHIVEVLLSSMRPVELLAGKIAGVGAVGLFQMLLWAVFLAGASVATGFGSGESLGSVQGLVFPDIRVADGAVLVMSFILGYLLYAAMFAAMGATVGSESEARQAQFPVILLLVVPTILLPAVVSAPEGTLAVALSYIPFSSPIIVPVQWITGAMDGSEVFTSAAVLLLTSIFVTIMAAKIYRIGILASGSRPGWRELLRWIRMA